MRRKLSAVIAPLLCAFAAAVAAAAPSPARAEDLRAAIDRILDKPALQGAAVGVRVIELPTGKVLYSYNADEVLSVASNAKVVTTAAALDTLGAAFDLTTAVVARGELKDGVLTGDLVIIGKGDPSMSTHWYADATAPLRKMAAECRAAGVRVVSGDLVADDLYFDREYLCPTWPGNQWINWYVAPVGAMALNDNCVDVVISPGPAEGAPAVLKFGPNVGYVRLTNSITTTSNRKRHGYSFVRERAGNTVSAKGFYYKSGGETRGNFTIHDPAMYLATAMRKALADAGIEVRGKTRLMEPAETAGISGAKVMAVNRIALGEVIKYCNQNSQNLYAEMVLKTLGREAAGEGSFRGGAQGIAMFLDKLGVLPGTYQVADGSGLSHGTKYSARILTEVLKYAAASPQAATFRDSLPLSGTSGTLEDRLADPKYKGRIRAKTGYISNACALSGYARAANGKTLAFSIIFNRHKGAARPIQDEICRALVDSAP